MHIEKSRFGEDIVVYDSLNEQRLAIDDYLKGNYSALSSREIKAFRELEEDPDGTRWEREHAGVFADNVDQFDLDELSFVYDIGRTLDEGRAILRDMIGQHPITPLTIWRLERKLAAKTL